MRIFINILTLLFLLKFNFAIAEVRDFPNKDCDITVGLLRTEKETYDHEWASSDKICEMLVSMGAHVILIDYNKLFSKAKEEALSETKDDVIHAEQLESKKIKEVVKDFIKDSKINRILLPGNYYNLDSDPLPPTPNRQLVTKAIVQIVDENPNISLLSICGGLQGIMHAKGIEIISMKKLHKIQESKKSYHNDRRLNKLKIAPESRLSSMVSRFAQPDEDGWFAIYFPDAHGEMINNSDENIEKLQSLGYKVIGLSDDDVIEAIEDKHGNIHFQGHPESLILRSKRYYSENYKKREIATLITMAIINDFLYRKCEAII
ncbi:glutamine amidotransferase-related protein [Candidatus Mesenet endosymbiont of Phosphuga atrata]|uniref:glutamine amidotransferase-related protein n=1 Tax=Candidatus Mesenet endosymbiont of Phosphuga atrata TaxID=3066221 RepID=UPI0030CCED3C